MNLQDIEVATFAVLQRNAKDKGVNLLVDSVDTLDDTVGCVLFKFDHDDLATFQYGHRFHGTAAPVTRLEVYRTIASKMGLEMPFAENRKRLGRDFIVNSVVDLVDGMLSAENGLVFDEEESRSWCLGWNMAKTQLGDGEDQGFPELAQEPLPVQQPTMPVRLDLSEHMPAPADPHAPLMPANAEEAVEHRPDPKHWSIAELSEEIRAIGKVEEARTHYHNQPGHSGYVEVNILFGDTLRVDFNRKSGTVKSEQEAWVLMLDKVRNDKSDEIPF